MSRVFLMIGSVLGMVAVVAGAFGAHALRNAWSLLADGAQRTAWWKLASEYLLAHAIAVLVVGALSASRTSVWFQRSGFSFAIGVLIFSGSLYAMAFTGDRRLGMITPIGGVLLILGWVFLLVAVTKQTG